MNIQYGDNDKITIENINSSIRNINIEVNKESISSLEEFLQMENNPAGRYYLTNDIDFADYIPGVMNDSLIKSAFSGSLDGRAHDIRITGFNNEALGRDYVNAFAKETDSARLSDIYIDDITLKGKNYTAIISGVDRSNSIFERISVTNSNVTSDDGYYSSLLVGRKYGGSITDAYIDGTLNVTSTENGGIVGAIYKGASIRNSFYLGKVTGDTYSFTGADNKSLFTQCYEWSGTGGISAIDGKNILGTELGRLNKELYNNLNFSPSIWSYHTIQEGWMQDTDISIAQFIYLNTLYIQDYYSDKEGTKINDTNRVPYNTSEKEALSILDKTGYVQLTNGKYLTIFINWFFEDGAYDGTEPGVYKVIGKDIVAIDAKTGEPIKLSMKTKDGILIKLDKSTDIIFMERVKEFQDTKNHLPGLW